MLASSAFLISTAFTRSLQNAILPPSLEHCEDNDISAALSSWSSLSDSEQPSQQSRSVQKAWAGKIASVVQASLMSSAESPLDQARLLSACAEHSEYRLYAPPITAVGLRLTDEMIRISVGTRLGARTCEPMYHIFHCTISPLCHTHVSLRHDGRRKRFAWPFLPLECSQTSETLTSE